MFILRGLVIQDASDAGKETLGQQEFLTENMQATEHDMDVDALDTFLVSVETDAYRLALAACRNPDDALDLVQDAMLELVKRYRSKPHAQWPPLFHRILQNKIRDWFRRRSVKHALLRWSGLGDTSEKVQQMPASPQSGPEAQVHSGIVLARIEHAISQLPYRQQQAFLLRGWKEMSTQETATAMSISEGSVKTHYSRALSALRVLLESDWEHECD